MKIISKFTDYYDGYSDYTSEDPKVKYYIRKKEHIQVSKYILEYLENVRLRTPVDFKAAYIIIAGKVYPFVSVETPSEWKYIDGKETYIKSKTDYYFEPGPLMDHYTEIRKKQTNAYYKHKNPWWVWRNGYLSERDVNNFFNINFPDMSDLCIEHNTPIILISPEDQGYREKEKTYRNCVKDINLKDYGLSKVYKSPEMYQILDMFIGNVLVKDEMPMSPMTDKEKIQSHGFNESSFRKAPNPKPRKKKRK